MITDYYPEIFKKYSMKEYSEFILDKEAEISIKYRKRLVKFEQGKFLYSDSGFIPAKGIVGFRQLVPAISNEFSWSRNDVVFCFEHYSKEKGFSVVFKHDDAVTDVTGEKLEACWKLYNSL